MVSPISRRSCCALIPAAIAANSLSAATPAFAAEQGERRLTDAFAAIDSAMAASSAPGMVAAITNAKGLVKTFAHGYADLKQKTPLSIDAPFEIGSISKSFTAVALMQLVDEGKFDPHVPITKYLPWFQINSKFAPITGHHLLSHTSGLPNYRSDMSSSRFAAYALRDFEPTYAPGEHYWYSNLGFQILGYVLEAIEHDAYDAIVARRVLQPLGMTGSYSKIDDSLRSKLPVSYVRWPYDGAYVEAPWLEYASADGSIGARAADMAAYARLVLNHGMASSRRLLSARAFDMLTGPVVEVPNDRKAARYAYGLWKAQAGDETIIGHSGSIAGFRSMLQMHMKAGFAVFTSSTAPTAGLDEWIVDTVADAYAGKPPKPAPSASEQSNISGFAGTYTAPDGRTVEFIARNGTLSVRQGDQTNTLVRSGRSAFHANAGLPFVFVAGSDGKAVEVSRGEAWYASEAYAGPKTFTAPPEYQSYPGRYDDHNLEESTSGERWIYILKGRLMSQSAHGGGMTELIPLGPGVFRPREPSYTPERYRFDTVVDGKALRLTVSGAPMYRIGA